MRNLLATLLITVTLSTIGFAQAEFGVKAGFHQSSIDGDNVEDFEMKYGPAFAGFAKLPLGTKFSFQPELQYGAYGTQFEEDNDLKIILNQINIPLKFNFYTGAMGNDEGFKINLGPQVGFNIKDEVQFEGEDADFSDSVEEAGGEFSEVDFGATLNLGYEFTNGIWLETGAYHSLSPVVEGEGEKNYNTVGTFTIGYNFNNY